MTDSGLVTSENELIPAQTVIISIGDIPALSFLPKSVETITVGGAAWVTTDKAHRTSDAQVLAVGDVERPGLATHALGAGKTAAEYIIADCQGIDWKPFDKPSHPTEGPDHHPLYSNGNRRHGNRPGQPMSLLCLLPRLSPLRDDLSHRGHQSQRTGIWFRERLSVWVGKQL